VLSGDVAQARVLEEEIFGPVLCVTRFDDEDLASIAAKVNATPYGLSANVWTRDISKALGLARLIQSGSVRINGGTGYDMAVPFGGYKQSGIGRENGGEGVKAYTELKAVTVAL
jgi:phenylacetaldehyde dehydrogenase